MEKFLAFHALASQRKMDLAMRGLDVPNFSIDDLFEESERTRLPPPAWDGFLRQRLPSPRADPSVCAALNAAADNRRLRHIAGLLAGCSHGDDDVDIDLYLDACYAFVRLLEDLGTFAALSVQEATNNLRKIAESSDGVRARGSSLLALLSAEARAGVHGPGGLLKDPSAAMGVLWIARYLAFWEEVCARAPRGRARSRAQAALPRSRTTF